eukprot:m.174966 g.174966  ORF g.174966 m.174966 type:complete len:332 (-) comp14885_c3_seq3:1839-2834(-)
MASAAEVYAANRPLTTVTTVPVLADRFTTPLATAEVWIANVVQPRDTNTLLKALHRAHPLPALGHCKRVSRRKPEPDAPAAGPPILCVLLFDRVAAATSDEAAALLVECECHEMVRSPRVATVPAAAPLTRAHFDAASALWPVLFHEDKRITQALDDALFTDAERATIGGHLEQAAAAAAAAGTHNAAVLVDGTTVIATEATPPRHPLDHLAMRVIDVSAKRQLAGGGNSAKRARVHQSADQAPLDGQDSRGEITTTDGAGYLCSDMDLFVLHEPCVMCSMALLHSRIGRVFYCESGNGCLCAARRGHMWREMWTFVCVGQAVTACGLALQ